MRASDAAALQGYAILSDPTSRFFFVASGNSVNEIVADPYFLSFSTPDHPMKATACLLQLQLVRPQEVGQRLRSAC